jgi:2-C-methyl-D-erythritol 4-phosphate cytidylyltransferase
MLGDRALLAWSTEMLLAAGCSPVIVVLPEDRIEAGRAISGENPAIVFVAGGPTRQASVERGLQHVDTEAVIVHDAVRPFAKPEIVPALIEALVRFDGAICAVAVSETIKEAEGSRVLTTVDRSRLWRAQTPQAFRTARLRAAHQRATERGIHGTDDAQLVEAYGGAVGIVEGSNMNIKLTFPEDFTLAEAMITAGLV